MTTWYRAGTVSVTNGSATVSGSGTAFSANVRIGEEFRLAGASVGYEILAVVSDTQLTLASNYLGSTQSGQAYEIVPVRGFLKQAYDALSSAVNSFSAYQAGALAGRFGAGSLAEPGIAFETDVNTGIRRPAADTLALVAGGADQVSLVGGVATGAAVQSSATDVTAGKLMRADYGFSRGNLLGTVSQSGGVPTGAVVERGSNANGEYVRFADGTQICWRQFDDTSVSAWSTASGSFYIRDSALNLSFPATFSAAPSVAPTTIVNSLGVDGCKLQVVSATNVLMRPWSSVSLNLATAKGASYIAVGHWY